MQKPKHKEPTNYEHCCSCVPELEKEIKHLKLYIESYINKENVSRE